MSDNSLDVASDVAVLSDKQRTPMQRGMYISYVCNVCAVCSRYIYHVSSSWIVMNKFVYF